MARIGGSRRKRVGIFKKSTRKKGKISHREYLKELKEGDRVILKLEPAVQNAIYLPRFHGKHGVVMRKQGSCYEVEIKDQNKTKYVVVHPIHLKKSEQHVKS